MKTEVEILREALLWYSMHGMYMIMTTNLPNAVCNSTMPIMEDSGKRATTALRQARDVSNAATPIIQKKELEPISDTLAEEIAEACVKEWDEKGNALKVDIKSVLLSKLAQSEDPDIQLIRDRDWYKGKFDELFGYLGMDEADSTWSSHNCPVENAFAAIWKLQEAQLTPAPQGEWEHVLLKEGDVIQKGDEYCTYQNNWYETKSIGMKVAAKHDQAYRRKVRLNQWPTPIKFSERIPEEGQKIIALNDKGWTGDFTYKNADKFEWYTSENFSYWLLAPPKPESSEKVQPSKRNWDEEEHLAARDNAQAEPPQAKSDLVERIKRAKLNSPRYATHSVRMEVFDFLEELALKVEGMR